MLKDLLVGAKVYFAREGVMLGAVTPSETVKPDHAVVPYPELGCNEQWEASNNKTELKRRCATNGVWGTRKTFITQKDLVHNFSMQEWNEMTFAELLLQGSTPAAVTGAFVSNTGEGQVRGWLYVPIHNYDGELIATLNFWCELSVGSYQFKEGVDPYTLKANVLANALNEDAVAGLVA